MVEKRDIEKLAALSRIRVEPEEYEPLARDIEAILSYISNIKNVSAEGVVSQKGGVRNVFRDDGEPHPPGQFTEKLLANAPAVLRGYLKVKNIIAQD